MDPRFRYAAPAGRRSPPLHNPARASMPVNIGSSYPSAVYGADPHASQLHVATRYDDPITPRAQATVDFRNAPAVPTPPQLHKTQQTSGTTAPATAAGQPSHPPHHQHQHSASQDHHHLHHAQHQSSMPPPPVPTTTSCTYTIAKDPIARSSSLREPPRTHRASFNEATQKRPIIITTTTGGNQGAPSSTATSRGPPSPIRGEFRTPSAEPARGSSMRDDSYYYAMPAASAGSRSRGARYSYSGAPMSATLDNDEFTRLRERHDAVHAGSRVDSFPRTRPVSAYVNIPRSGAVPGSGVGAGGSLASGAGSASLSAAPTGSAAGSGANNYGDQGYEYTKPSDLARYDLTYEQAGSRRGHRDSFDRNYYRPTVNLTTEVGRPYGYELSGRRPGGGSNASGSSGPPPTTWGLDKINRTTTAPVSSSQPPIGYDPVTSMRPVVHAATAGAGATSLAPPASVGSSIRSSSRQRSASLYHSPPDDYYRGHDDDVSRDRRGGDRDRDNQGRNYRDRSTFRDGDRDREHERNRDWGRDRDRDGPRDKARDSVRDNEWDRNRVRGPQEYYADGSSANRAFGILVNSRDHQLRQAPPETHGGIVTGTVAGAAAGAAGATIYNDYRSTYADEDMHRERREPREHNSSRYNGIDRDFIRGRPDHTERLGIETPKRKETDDDMYVHHPQEGMRHWDSGDRYKREDDYGRDRERERDTRESRRERERVRESDRDRDRNHDREREHERVPRDHEAERERERERERARDREMERERERERERARERDREHGHDQDTRPPRPTADEGLANTKKSRDKAPTGLGIAATTAAAAGLAASVATNESNNHSATKTEETASHRSRRDRERNSDDSPHSADDRDRHRDREHEHGHEDRRHASRKDDDTGSEKSHVSKTSAYTIPAPVAAPPPATGEDGEGPRTHPVDRTPSTSEDGESDKGSREPGTRKRRQHTTSSFVPTNTEDLKALKAELAALEAKEAKDGKDNKNSKYTNPSKKRDEITDGSPSGHATSKSNKDDKVETVSPKILTPSSSLSSAHASPTTRPVDHLDKAPSTVAAVAGTAAAMSAASSSKGKGKDTEARRDGSPEQDSERTSDRELEIVPEPDEPINSRRGRDESQPPSKGLVVRLVSPPREKKEKQPVKGILKTPSTKFPEEANPIREGVAPHKDDKTKQQGVPPGARWTRISRKLVNPEALTIGKERFEVRDDFVIVLRVLSREEIEAYTIATAQIRDLHRKEYDSRHHDDRDKDKDKDKERDDDERRRHRSHRDRDRDRDRDRERDRDRDRDRDRERGRDKDQDDDDDYYGGSGGGGGGSSARDRPRRHHRHESESYDGTDSKQPTIEYHSSRSSGRQYHHR